MSVVLFIDFIIFPSVIYSHFPTLVNLYRYYEYTLFSLYTIITLFFHMYMPPSLVNFHIFYIPSLAFHTPTLFNFQYIYIIHILAFLKYQYYVFKTIFYLRFKNTSDRKNMICLKYCKYMCIFIYIYFFKEYIFLCWNKQKNI